jgi:putative CocE/NonD family hydrolase
VRGAVDVDLHVSTSGTDADVVVKLIDVHPDHASSGMAGFQQMVRGEPFRGKFRESFERPVPFVPNEPARIAFTLGEVAHTFRRGHRVMLHVQGSWFPLIDRNPQTFTHIPNARPDQFVKATHRVYRGGVRASSIILPVAR